MMRRDLLALSDADLADISNRGNVKRATRELDRGDVTWKCTEDDGTLTFRWSDGPTCVLAADVTLEDATCSCAATGMCRHIVRSVLAYQRDAAEASETLEPAGPWDPGTISDALLEQHFPARITTRAHTALEDEGVVVELVRSAKPIARFHKLGHTVRFLVPGDVRYTQCDCDERMPCSHVPIAVLAFRLLEAEQAAGLVVTGGGEEQVDPALLDAVESALGEIVGAGLSNMNAARMDRHRALEKRLRDAGLVWPAEIFNDLRRQYDYYHAHDARFSPPVLADLVGELVIRLDALRNEDLPIPRLFVRGDHSDRESRMGQARLVGLGCWVVHRHRAIEIMAMMQDVSSGKMMAISREFTDPEEEDAREDFARLASRLVVHGRDLATIGRGQAVVKKARLHASHRLSLSRSAASIYSQNYAWDDLRAPVGAADFSEIRARLAQLPPASLRPRRIGEDFHVCELARVENVRFDVREQALRATVYDVSGEPAELYHPYSTRNRHGTERLLNWLVRHPDDVRFLAARMHLAPHGLRVMPTAVVFEVEGTRTMIQPWIDDMDAHLEVAEVQVDDQAVVAVEPVGLFLDRYRARIGDSILVGEERTRIEAATSWPELGALAGRLGLRVAHRLIEDFLRTAERDGDVESGSLAALLLEHSALSRLAQELS